MKWFSNLVAVNWVEVNIVKSVMKMFGGVTTARQDGCLKMITATGESSVISVVKSTIFSVLALIMHKSNIRILILKTRCFFVKNVNKSLALYVCMYIYIYIYIYITSVNGTQHWLDCALFTHCKFNPFGSWIWLLHPDFHLSTQVLLQCNKSCHNNMQCTLLVDR